MTDGASKLTETEMAELCALADGTLPAERRAAVEARVAASAELQELLERQRQAVAATRVLADEPAPASLREAVEARRRPRERRRAPSAGLFPRIAVACGLAAVVAVVLAVVLSGGPGAPTVAEAAQLTDRPPTGPAPPPVDAAPTKLSVDLEGVVFPNLTEPFGWRAAGVRRDTLDGRNVTVVFYAKEGRRIGYAIVGGDALPRPSDAETAMRAGIVFQTLRLGDRRVVTWRRAGHTCVLVGGAPAAELLALANWRGGGVLLY